MVYYYLPSAVLATLFAVWLLILQPNWLQESWMHIKLTFVVALFAYHWSCQVLYNQIEKGALKYSSFALRIWNEVATLILFSCVFLVVLKSTFDWIFGVIGIVGVSVLLMLGIKLYKNIRNKKAWEK